MKKHLTFLLIVFSYVAVAQETPRQDIQKLVDDKSFVFVATASFGNIPNNDHFWQAVYSPAPTSTLQNDASINTFLRVMSNTAGFETTRNKNDEFPVVYVHNESAQFHPSVLQRASDQFYRINSDLNNPFVFENYMARTNKKGKTTINFNIQVHRFDKRDVNLVILPDGKAEMTITTSSGPMRVFKGYIQGLASL